MPAALVNDGALWFTIPACIGTIFFLVQMVLMLIGGGELGIDGDLDHGDPTDTFKILSIQSIAAFLMGSGWGGIAGLRAFDWSWSSSLIFGMVCGAGMVWLLAIVLKAVHDLQSSGNVRMEHAAGAEGTVYASIPGSGAGRGQVQVVVDGRQRTYAAISEGEPIPSHTRIRVVRVNEDRTLTVTPA